MTFTPEPNIILGIQKPETILQEAVTKLVVGILERNKGTQSLVEYFILSGFGLDLAVFIQQNDHSTVRFLEFKTFMGSRPGGVGFGTGKGKGSQVDLLLLENAKLGLADQHIRWILVDGTKPFGQKRFVIFSSSRAKGETMGGIGREKQNNLRISSLMTTAITWDDLSRELESFVLKPFY